MSAFHVIATRFYGAAYFARAAGKQASATQSERCAVDALVKKLFPEAGEITVTCQHACAPHNLKGWQPGRWTASNPK